MKKAVPIISFLGLLITLIILVLIYHILNYNYHLEISSITKISFNSSTNEIVLNIKSSVQDYTCLVYDEKTKYEAKSTANDCILTVPIGKDYSVMIKQNDFKSPSYKLLNFIDNLLETNINYDTIYLTIGETKNLNLNFKTLNGQVNSFKSDHKILEIKDNTITAKQVGTTSISNDLISLKVIVTDLIGLPTITNTKNTIPCNYYSQSDSDLLDKILKYKVEEASYLTRSAVVAAARFLSLEFPFKIPYFYENGRLHSSGVNYVDGEGRYYHPGLYLNETKTKEIMYSFRGPAIWGCPLTNLEYDPESNYIPGTLMPNGLDCSGFVTWALLNAGYEPLDIGANALARLGDYVYINSDLINSSKIKAGDLISYPGHIGMIIGIDEENFYVAESLAIYKGLSVNTYNKQTVGKYFTGITLMDDYYQNDGNYSALWS